MKLSALLLSLLLIRPAFGQDLSISASTSSADALPPLIITAPSTHEDPSLRIKQARAAGGLTAAGGLGLMAYAAFAGTGPVGWAAALVFLGGMTAYLSHRRIQGKDDFGPGNHVPLKAVKPTAA
jgi:hypothetical protein